MGNFKVSGSCGMFTYMGWTASPGWHAWHGMVLVLREFCFLPWNFNINMDHLFLPTRFWCTKQNELTVSLDVTCQYNCILRRLYTLYNEYYFFLRIKMWWYQIIYTLQAHLQYSFTLFIFFPTNNSTESPPTVRCLAHAASIVAAGRQLLEPRAAQGVGPRPLAMPREAQAAGGHLTVWCNTLDADPRKVHEFMVSHNRTVYIEMYWLINKWKNYSDKRQNHDCKQLQCKFCCESFDLILIEVIICCLMRNCDAPYQTSRHK